VMARAVLEGQSGGLTEEGLAEEAEAAEGEEAGETAEAAPAAEGATYEYDEDDGIYEP